MIASSKEQPAGEAILADQLRKLPECRAWRSTPRSANSQCKVESKDEDGEEHSWTGKGGMTKTPGPAAGIGTATLRHVSILPSQGLSTEFWADF